VDDSFQFRSALEPEGECGERVRVRELGEDAAEGEALHDEVVALLALADADVREVGRLEGVDVLGGVVGGRPELAELPPRAGPAAPSTSSRAARPPASRPPRSTELGRPLAGAGRVCLTATMSPPSAATMLTESEGAALPWRGV
jgi:hypothetical protein